MEYKEFKKKEDAKRAAMYAEAKTKANKAYNKGLWNAVKWSPFKWWAYAVYMREV